MPDQVRHDILAQASQMQALSRADAGSWASNSALKSTCVHQHGGCFTPVACSTSMAHWFTLPHNGQRLGSGMASGCMPPV